MNRFFRYDAPFWGVMGRVFDLVVLNWLWLLTSLPLVTLGASTTALYTVTLRMARGEDSHNLSGYLRAFAGNLKQATALWLLYAAAAAWLVLGSSVMSHSGQPFLQALAIAEAGLLVLVLLGLPYAFALQARFSNTVRGTILAAQTLALRILPISAAVAALVLAPALLAGLYTPLSGAVALAGLFVGASGIALLHAKLLSPILERSAARPDTV